jgi:AraC family transcriptional regulator
VSDDPIDQIALERDLLARDPRIAHRAQSTPRRPPPVLLDEPRIARAIRLIERTPAETIGLSAIARHVGLSLFHFQRLFQGVMGETPSAYMRRTRLDRAAMNLQMSRQAITAIALNAGYASHEAFVRAFHRQFGTVPSQYRSIAQQALPRAAATRFGSGEPALVEEWPACTLLAMRFHGPYPTFEAHWTAFHRHLASIGIDPARVEAVGITYDTPLITPDALFRHDCAIIDRGLDVTDPLLQPLAFRQGRYVRMRHRQPFQAILQTYASVSLDWLARSGEMFLPDGNGGYKVYHQAPWTNVGRAHDLSVVLPLA